MSEVPEKFATALDNEDYESASTCLSDTCQYESPEGRLCGPAAIIESYRGNGDSARDRFDAIEYSHQVQTLPNGWFVITFVDRLLAASTRHTFRCRQRVKVNSDRITSIIHEEIEGERARLNEFLRGVQ